jgi:hypothetical protein
VTVRPGITCSSTAGFRSRPHDRRRQEAGPAVKVTTLGGHPARSIASLAALLGVVPACAGRPSGDVAPAVRCEVGDTVLVRDVVYFGRNRPAGGTVSEADWQAFLDEVVTPRFPAGLTVVAARGQWRGREGAVEREQAEVLTVFHPDDAAARRAVMEIATEYKRRFQQEAVLRERAPACTRFE